MGRIILRADGPSLEGCSPSDMWALLALLLPGVEQQLRPFAADLAEVRAFARERDRQEAFAEGSLFSAGPCGALQDTIRGGAIS